MPAVIIRDIRLYYERYGNGEPVVFSHGMLDDCSVWKAQTGTFAQQHTVILYDHRGHGRSDKPRGDYSVQTLAGDLNSLILELNLDKVTLVGHSLGGMTALMFTLGHPDRVSRLVLVSTSASTLVRLPLAGATTSGLGSLVACGMFARRTLGRKLRGSRGRATDIVPGSDAKVPKHVAHSCMRGLITSYDVRDRLSQIQAPTLVIAGGRDKDISLRMSRSLHSEIEGSRLEVIPNCGHAPMIEKPVEFSNVLSAFLA
jgi:pimeloyl-ACP methyl ester carboxylesterase